MPVYYPHLDVYNRQLLLWLTLMGRALWPALQRKNEMSSIAGLLFLSVIASGLLYSAGLMWRENTHISMVTYWRFWIVHLWVEGFFEVFAVAVISFIFVKLGLVRGRSATINVLFATIAVSYTHLDVYKRQRCARRPRPVARPCRV